MSWHEFAEQQLPGSPRNDSERYRSAGWELMQRHLAVAWERSRELSWEAYWLERGQVQQETLEAACRQIGDNG